MRLLLALAMDIKNGTARKRTQAVLGLLMVFTTGAYLSETAAYYLNVWHSMPGTAALAGGTVATLIAAAIKTS